MDTIHFVVSGYLCSCKVCETFYLQITTFIVAFGILDPVVSGQDISFTSFLETVGRNYTCPGEIVTYVCNGTGYEIDIYAPPYINNLARHIFSESDRVGSGVGSGPIGSFLFSTDGDYISVGVVVRDSSLGECEIFCEIHSSTGTSRAKIVHIPSGTYS